MSEDIREYVVTLKEKSMLDEFYDDMESPGGNLYIPNRRAEVSDRREISRNTHYCLTEQEAQSLKQDPRVLDVDLTIKESNSGPVPMVVQYSDHWDKRSFAAESNSKNWGLLRCYEGAQRLNWSDSVTTGLQSGTIELEEIGRNVDVVIADGHIPDPNSSVHLEFRSNADGSGTNRFVFYNWMQHSLFGGSYVYSDNPTYLEDDQANNNHGVHVGGTVAGNTQGWARGANVYNLSPYSSSQNTSVQGREIDFIRYFHNAKPINSAIGRKNPTISNHSYIFADFITNTNVHQVVVRGSIVYDKNTQGTLTLNQALGFGLQTDFNSSTNFEIYINARNTSIDADVADAIEDGIIMVAAAGNYNYQIDVPWGVDYNNHLVLYSSNGPKYYYARGASPGAAPGMICVGAVGANSTDSIASFSNRGPRIDVWAPGQNIMSSVRFGGTPDPRDFNTRVGKMSGTSMASPQVCGVLACALEKYPYWTQTDARKYLQRSLSVDGQVAGAEPYSTNRFLRYFMTRGGGTFWPDNMDLDRPTDVTGKNGMMWPRNKIKR